MLTSVHKSTTQLYFLIAKLLLVVNTLKPRSWPYLSTGLGLNHAGPSNFLIFFSCPTSSWLCQFVAKSSSSGSYPLVEHDGSQTVSDKPTLSNIATACSVNSKHTFLVHVGKTKLSHTTVHAAAILSPKSTVLIRVLKVHMPCSCQTP